MINKLTVAAQKLSPGVRKIIGNTSWLMADQIVRQCVVFVVGVLLARYLGPEEFGLYNYAVAFVLLFSAIAKLGLDSIVVRDIVRDPSCKDETLGTAFFLKLIAGAGTFLLAVGTIYLLRPEDTLTAWLVAITAAGMIFQAFDTIDFWFQSQVQSKYTVLAKSGSFLLVSLFKIFLIQMRAPIIAFAWAGLAELFLGAAGLAIIYQTKAGKMGLWRKSFSRAKALLRDSCPLILSGMAVVIYMRIDQVMLGELASGREVGNYSVAVRLVEACYFIPTQITASLFPSIINSKKNTLIYESRIQNLYDFMIWMGLISALLLSGFSGKIITFLFGDEYNGAVAVLPLQAWMSASVFFGIARTKWLIAEGHVKEILHIQVVAVSLNICANFILIPMYGAVGASLASLATASGANLIVAGYSKPIRHSMKMYVKSIALPFTFIKNKLGNLL